MASRSVMRVATLTRLLRAVPARLAPLQLARSYTVSPSGDYKHERKARSFRYENKVVLVTGGSRGIGEGITRVFAREGAHVVFCGLPKHSPSGRKLEAELNGKGPGKAMYVECDLTKPAEIDAFVSSAVSRFGRIDCVVANAGWHPHAHPIDEFSLEDFRALVDINLVAPWYFIRASIKELRKTKGNVINIGSISGYFGQAGSSTYCATKAGLTGLAKSLAIDEAAHDVRVNVVSPGNIWTPLWEEHVEGPTADADITAGKNAQLLGRMGTIEEVGEVCLHLATSEFTTGFEYLLTGGAEVGYGPKNQKKGGK